MTPQSLTRPNLLALVAASLSAVSCSHPLRVGIDGIDAAGKTTLADELAVYLRTHQQRTILRASADDFQRPRSHRHRCGSLAPAGYYYDAFDYSALIRSLLAPLGPAGLRYYRTRTFAYRTDQPVTDALEHAAPDTILLVDGVFLLRPELRPYWDITIFVDIPFETALARALKRDLEIFGSEDVIRTRYTRRYMPAQQLYFEQVCPRDNADIVIENTDPTHPLLRMRSSERCL